MSAKYSYRIQYKWGCVLGLKSGRMSSFLVPRPRSIIPRLSSSFIEKLLALSHRVPLSFPPSSTLSELTEYGGRTCFGAPL